MRLSNEELDKNLDGRWDRAYVRRIPIESGSHRQTTTLIRYGTNDKNQVALYEEVDDLDRFFELLGAPETAAAMAEDHVKRDTVNVVVLDAEWRA